MSGFQQHIELSVGEAPLLLRGQGQVLAERSGVGASSTLILDIHPQVIAAEGFWMGLCDNVVQGCSTLAEVYSRITLNVATEQQREVFERSMRRAMGKRYTVSD